MPFVTIIDEIWGGISYTGCMLYYHGHVARLIICDPKVVEALYTTRNAFLNKHHYTKSFQISLLGHSILFEETSENWRQRRKAMTPAFYKDKLRGLVNLASRAVKESIKNMIVDQERTIEIISEISKITASVILTCALGEDISDWKIDFWEGGKCTKKDTLYCLRWTFNQL